MTSQMKTARRFKATVGVATPPPCPLSTECRVCRNGTSKWDRLGEQDWVSFFRHNFPIKRFWLLHFPILSLINDQSYLFLHQGFLFTAKLGHKICRTIADRCNMGLEEISSAKCFGGSQKVFKHHRSVVQFSFAIVAFIWQNFIWNIDFFAYGRCGTDNKHLMVFVRLPNLHPPNGNIQLTVWQTLPLPSYCFGWIKILSLHWWCRN